MEFLFRTTHIYEITSPIYSQKLVEKIYTHILRPITFAKNSCRLCDKVKKNCVQADGIQMTVNSRT